ncbi:MAG: DNA replication/repair protein RecF [Gammaproteobacteria bacterium]|nr:DNA replication/repair protein RecF [Gammaproteobacteria bacterium]
MKINRLEITNFRNLQQVAIELGPRINLFYGENGSGKTSLLEVLHYLGIGRSFRTRNIARLIHHGAEGFSIFTQLTQPCGATLPVGVERSKDNSASAIRIGGQAASSLVEIASILPLQFINADSHLLLNSGPLTRRQFLDWGVFHVEPSFFTYWQRSTRILRQRNASLKISTSYSDLSAWDEELIISADWLDMRRRAYLADLEPVLYPLLSALLPDVNLHLHYFPGWSSQRSLQDALCHSFLRDKQAGYTHQGPHRADLQIKLDTVNAADLLSHGQQKLVAYALKLAQGLLLHSQRNKQCVYLIDDLPSELDKSKRKLVTDIINSMEAQIFITGIEIDSFADLAPSPEAKMFHVEHGNIR